MTSISLGVLLLAYKTVNPDNFAQSEGWLDPPFLTADFNGDSYLDTAFSVIKDSKKGILIKHGNSGNSFLLGAGTEFGNGGDNFDWVKEWHLVSSGKSYEVTFLENGDIDGTRKVILDYPSFYIGDQFYGGATITWKENKYEWIHQAE